VNAGYSSTYDPTVKGVRADGAMQR